MGSLNIHRQSSFQHSHYLFVFVLNESCKAYIYCTYFYYGLYKFFSSSKGDGGLQKEKEIQYEEQIKINDAIIPKIRESIRFSIRQSILRDSDGKNSILSNKLAGGDGLTPKAELDGATATPTQPENGQQQNPLHSSNVHKSNFDYAQ